VVTSAEDNSGVKILEVDVEIAFVVKELVDSTCSVVVLCIGDDSVG
jgi:hypothetical protein